MQVIGDTHSAGLNGRLGFAHALGELTYNNNNHDGFKRFVGVALELNPWEYV